MGNEAFNKKIRLQCRTLNLNLRKKLTKYFGVLCSTDAEHNKSPKADNLRQTGCECGVARLMSDCKMAYY